MSIEDAIMGGIVFKGKKDKPQEEEKDEDESEESDLYSWTTWFRSREDESGYSEKRANRQ